MQSFIYRTKKLVRYNERHMAMSHHEKTTLNVLLLLVKQNRRSRFRELFCIVSQMQTQKHAHTTIKMLRCWYHPRENMRVERHHESTPGRARREVREETRWSKTRMKWHATRARHNLSFEWPVQHPQRQTSRWRAPWTTARAFPENTEMQFPRSIMKEYRQDECKREAFVCFPPTRCEADDEARQNTMIFRDISVVCMIRSTNRNRATERKINAQVTSTNAAQNDNDEAEPPKTWVLHQNGTVTWRTPARKSWMQRNDEWQSTREAGEEGGEWPERHVTAGNLEFVTCSMFAYTSQTMATK